MPTRPSARSGMRVSPATLLPCTTNGTELERSDDTPAFSARRKPIGVVLARSWLTPSDALDDPRLDVQRDHSRSAPTVRAAADADLGRDDRDRRSPNEAGARHHAIVAVEALTSAPAAGATAPAGAPATVAAACESPARRRLRSGRPTRRGIEAIIGVGASARFSPLQRRPARRAGRLSRRNVKHWSSGEMGLRWAAAEMLEAERQFRKVIG